MWGGFFFFNDTATTEIYTLSLHDALPICARHSGDQGQFPRSLRSVSSGKPEVVGAGSGRPGDTVRRSEEHTSELQSQSNLVCRLLLEKKKHPSIQGGEIQSMLMVPLRHIG